MKKISLRKKIIILFLLTSTVPIILLSMFIFYNTLTMLRKNTESLTQSNLMQVAENLKISIDSYDDLLYQIYTNDDMVTWIDNLNRDEDVPVTISQMRRYLRGLLNTKNYIRSITVITSNGQLVTYDQLTPATYDNSWIKNHSMTESDLYQLVTSNNQTHILPTEFGTRFASNNYYLFHLAHYVIDYRNLEKRSGIVIISLDEQFISDTLNNNQDADEGNNYNFLVKSSGEVISHSDKTLIGRKIFAESDSLDQKRDKYFELVTVDQDDTSSYESLYTYYDPELQWEIVNVTEQSDFFTNLGRNVFISITISTMLLLITVVIVWKISGQLDDSVKSVVSTMQQADEGNLDARITVKDKMPVEIETIAQQFNDTLHKLNNSITKEIEAGEKQRKAEIRALEAQINPHFIYNTLDTINWMAIDRDEFDISNAINTLAVILRYAISNSNGTVTVREEVEWLKKYLYLQQFRLKSSFDCHINIEPEVMGFQIHKLLLQPFVENAIIHGFEGKKNNSKLFIQISKENDDAIRIEIEDNGKGMDQEKVDSLMMLQHKAGNSDKHIGIENAISRIHEYCQGQEIINITSSPGQGTKIMLVIHYQKKQY